MFDMYMGLAFGVIGYIARKTGYHVAAILIGVILGPLLETYFLRALKKSDGDIMTLFSSNLGNLLWVMLAVGLLPARAEEVRRSLLASSRWPVSRIPSRFTVERGSIWAACAATSTRSATNI